MAGGDEADGRVVGGGGVIDDLEIDGEEAVEIFVENLAVVVVGGEVLVAGEIDRRKIFEKWLGQGVESVF